MRRFSPARRSGLTLAVLLGLAALFAAMRVVQANGIFSSVAPGFAGVCKALPVRGVGDIEIDTAGRLAFLAVTDARRPGPDDGIYVLDLSAGPSGQAKPTRLAGTPADFHPRGIGLYRTANGGLFLAAVNHRAVAPAQAGAGGGGFSIDSFEVTRKNGTPALVAQGTVEGGLLADPQDVAMAGPNSFYVSNGVTAKNAVMRALQSYGIVAGGDIVYFNGMSFREAINGLPGARGMVLTADGDHVLVAGVSGRNIISLTRERFTGNLTEAGQLEMPSGPDKLALGDGDLWVGAHANLFAWRAFGRDPGKRAPSQVFRVKLVDGVPQSAGQVYGSRGSGGGEIAGAAIGAAAGRRLLIGSPLDGKLLDCEMK